MYRITRNEQFIGYLLGTMHLCRSEILEVPEIRLMLRAIRGIYTETAFRCMRQKVLLRLQEDILSKDCRSMEEDLIDYAETHRLLTRDLHSAQSHHVIEQLKEKLHGKLHGNLQRNLQSESHLAVQSFLECINCLEPIWISSMSSPDESVRLMDLMHLIDDSPRDVSELMQQRDQSIVHGIGEATQLPALFSIGWAHVNGVTAGLREAGYHLERIPLNLPRGELSLEELKNDLVSILK